MKTKAVVAGSAVVVGGVWVRRHRKNLRMAWNCLTGHSVMYKMKIDWGKSVGPMTNRAHMQECIFQGYTETESEEHKWPTEEESRLNRIEERLDWLDG